MRVGILILWRPVCKSKVRERSLRSVVYVCVVQQRFPHRINSSRLCPIAWDLQGGHRRQKLQERCLCRSPAGSGLVTARTMLPGAGGSPPNPPCALWGAELGCGWSLRHRILLEPPGCRSPGQPHYSCSCLILWLNKIFGL